MTEVDTQETAPAVRAIRGRSAGRRHRPNVRTVRRPPPERPGTHPRRSERARGRGHGGAARSRALRLGARCRRRVRRSPDRRLRLRPRRRHAAARLPIAVRARRPADHARRGRAASRARRGPTALDDHRDRPRERRRLRVGVPAALGVRPRRARGPRRDLRRQPRGRGGGALRRARRRHRRYVDRGARTTPFENAAVEARASLSASWFARDWPGLLALLPSEFRYVDRRPMALLELDRHGYVEFIRQLGDMRSVRIEGEMLATRAAIVSRLAGSRSRSPAATSGRARSSSSTSSRRTIAARRWRGSGSTPPTSTPPTPSSTRATTPARATAHPHAARVVAGVPRLVATREWDSMTARCVPGFVAHDHRLVSWGTVNDGAAWVDTLRVLVELAPDARYRIGPRPDVRPRVAGPGRMGRDARRRPVRDRHHLRLRSGRGRPPAAGRPVRAHAARPGARALRGDRQQARGGTRSTLRERRHPRLGAGRCAIPGAGRERHGPQALLGTVSLHGPATDGAARPRSRWLRSSSPASSGTGARSSCNTSCSRHGASASRSSAFACRWPTPTSARARSFNLNVIETDEHGQFVTWVRFDADDLDAAYAELDARFEAGEGARYGAATAANRAMREAYTRRDWEALTAAFALTFSADDHRLLGWGTTHRRPGDVACVRSRPWPSSPPISRYVSSICAFPTAAPSPRRCSTARATAAPSRRRSCSSPRWTERA